MRNKRSVAIVLSAGVGSRMNSDIPKQYIELMGKPIIYYTIKAFEESNVDGIVLV
ncbi:MAG TPA: 2-C-methyl-D-erythritol 4-phosphate cytidylyltransferase, partial [Eubacterium sp.]|nr:2-C-methyl-D-erythritol 4-phosphate cytidylyltransferase [Eubacterium sp.]